MELLIQNGPYCTTYSLAMVLNISPGEVHNLIGHKGTKVLWPDLAEPYCYQGIHLQECCDVVLALGKTMTVIEAVPMTAPNMCVPPREIFTDEECDERLLRYMKKYSGVLFGEISLKGGRFGNHAVAWDAATQKIYDPVGRIFDFPNQLFSIRQLCIIK